MEHFAIIDMATGKVVQTGECQEGDAITQRCADGQTVVVTETPLNDLCHYFNAKGELITAPPSPAPYAVFDVEAEEWIDPRSEAECAECMLAAKAEASEAINVERNRRIAGTFQFAGKPYDCDRDSLARITGASALAGFAMVQGVMAGNFLWHGGDTDFVWIAHDNSLTAMDAQTCFAFGQAAAQHQSAHIFAAKALKNMAPIPDDITSDAYWP